jgi:hypothetical protein
MRFAVLGLYNSGSSALAGMLHHLGANLGPPFWHNTFESSELAAALRTWWDEPRLTECVAADERQATLAAWIDRQEAASTMPAGAKHPLLSLCAPQLHAAWGADTRFLWARRPLGESVDGLTRRGWFPGREAAMQERLWTAIDAFVGTGADVTPIDFAQILDDPPATARRLAALLGLAPDDARFTAAVASVRTRGA